MSTSETLGQKIPPRVLDLISRIVPSGDHCHTDVILRQAGRLRRDGDSPWMRFSAHQSISLTECRFDWRARTGPGGLISVRDSFDGETGRGGVKLAGLIPLATAKPNAQLSRGELLRYLAELPWAPMAMLLNPALSWRDDGDAIFVSAGANENRAEIAFTFDAEGRVADAFTKDRPRATKDGFVNTPWRGRFSDYGECDGVIIPRAATVCWLTEGRETPVWSGRIMTWRQK